MHGNTTSLDLGLGLGLMAAYFLLPLFLAGYAIRRIYRVEHDIEDRTLAFELLALERKRRIRTAGPAESNACTQSASCLATAQRAAMKCSSSPRPGSTWLRSKTAATILLVAVVYYEWCWANNGAAMAVGCVAGSVCGLWGAYHRFDRVILASWLATCLHYWIWDLTRFWPPIDAWSLFGAIWLMAAFALATSAIAGRRGRLLARAHAIQTLFMANSLVGWEGLELSLLGSVAATVAFVLTAHRSRDAKILASTPIRGRG